MPRIELPQCTVEAEWDKGGHPVLYVTVNGKFNSPNEARDALQAVVEVVEASAFEHSCSVYNMFDVTHVPMLARVVASGKMPTSHKTAHIILGTTNTMIQLIGYTLAVAGNKRVRTIQLCKSPADIETAVKNWLALPPGARSHTVEDTRTNKG
jgi:hypothetical protein